MARKGCTFSLEMSRIIATIATTKAIIRDIPVITICNLRKIIQRTCVGLVEVRWIIFHKFVFYGRKNSPELGTEKISKLLKQYAMPAIIAMTASSLYNMVDSIFIGQGCGPMAISGLALTSR